MKKIFFVLFLVISIGFSNVFVVKDNTTYLIYTPYYAVSFDEYFDKGKMVLDNYYNITLFSNFEEVKKKFL